MSRRFLCLLGFLLLPWLSACGGGSDEPVQPVPPVSGSTVATTAPTVSSTPVSVVPTTTSNSASNTATCGLSSFQSELLSRINSLRASGASCGSRGQFAPVAAVSWRSALAEVAASHSKEMASAQYFSHTDLSGHDAGYRMRMAGYLWTAWAENIAAGQTTVKQVMDDWTASPGHCANLMNSSVTEVGVACQKVGSSTPYWTMNLARPV